MTEAKSLSLSSVLTDVGWGKFNTYELFLREFQRRGGRELMTPNHDGVVQVDIGVGTLVRKGIARVHVQRFTTNDGIVRDISIWEVDRRGRSVSDMFTLYNYPGEKMQQTVVYGSRRGSLDGHDMEILPQQMARRVDWALEKLSPRNWKIV